MRDSMNRSEEDRTRIRRNHKAFLKHHSRVSELK